MHGAFLLPLKPLHDASLVELAQALQPYQGLPNLIILHADGTLLRSPVMPQTVLLRSVERDHADRQGRLCRTAALGRARLSAVTLNTPPDMGLSEILVPVGAQRRKRVVADRAEITFVDAVATRHNGMRAVRRYRLGKPGVWWVNGWGMCSHRCATGHVPVFDRTLRQSRSKRAS